MVKYDPELELVSAVVQQAKADFVMSPEGSAEFAAVARWMNSESREVYGFRWACGLLGLDPEAVLDQAIRERAAVWAERQRQRRQK